MKDHEENYEDENIRESVVVYRARKKAIERLPRASQQARAWKYITDYGYYWIKPDPDEDPQSYIIYLMAEPVIDKNTKSFKDWCKWWRPRKDWKNSQKPPFSEGLEKNKPNENVNENVNEKEKEKENENVNEKEKEKENTNENKNQKEKKEDEEEKKRKKINYKVEYSDLFERFWNAYPKKKSKQQARIAWWNAIKWGNDPEFIIAKAGEYAREVRLKKIEDHYIKFAQWWLNEWRFDDDYFTGVRKSEVKVSESKPLTEEEKINIHRQFEWLKMNLNRRLSMD